MNAIRGLVVGARARAGLSQQALADRAGTAQSVVARIETGQNSPNLETLTKLVAAAGFELALELKPRPRSDPVVEAYKSGIDTTLLQEQLRKTPEQRVQDLTALLRLAEEARNAGAELHRAKNKKRAR